MFADIQHFKIASAASKILQFRITTDIKFPQKKVTSAIQIYQFLILIQVKIFKVIIRTVKY